MYYSVFPFGKYKGTKLKDLPSTYIVLALEKFELPEELISELRMILFSRLNVWTVAKELAKQHTKKDFVDLMDKLRIQYSQEINIDIWND